ncbi:MAG: type II secretion system protein GspD [Leptothrix sp. (in: b-proteobacteria)]
MTDLPLDAQGRDQRLTSRAAAATTPCAPRPSRLAWAIGMALGWVVGLALPGAAAQAAAAPTSDVKPAELPLRNTLDAATLQRRITLQLRDVPLSLALETLSKSIDIKFIPDQEVRRDQRCTLFLTDARVGEAIELLLKSQQLAMRALTDRSALIFPDTPAKQRAYGELQVRTLTLGHVDATTMATTLKTLLKSPVTVTEARGNRLVLRDTPEALDVAEQLVSAHDLPPGDVYIELQLIEVRRQQLNKLGLAWPSSFNLSTPASVATVGDLRALGGMALLATPLALGLNLQLQDIDATVIARPSVRARHKEKARLTIGDKVPVFTTNVASSGGTIGGSGVGSGGTGAASPVVDPGTGQGSVTDPAANLQQQGGGGQLLLSGAVQYIDVGLKLEVEPQLFADGDIGLALSIELNQINSSLDTGAGGVAYQIGTRQATTSMRLHDGETQWLGGLMNQQQRDSMTGLPGLSQLPVLGRLFGTSGADHSDTELILAITPRRVSPARLAPAGSALLDSGDETHVQAGAMKVSEAPDEAGLTDTRIEMLGNSRVGTAGSGVVVPIKPNAQGLQLQLPEMPGVPGVMPRLVPGRTPRQTPVEPMAPPPERQP